MIALDFDGVVANYGNHVNEIRFNPNLKDILPPLQRLPIPVAICTNQGGMALSAIDPQKYPRPGQVATRLINGAILLENLGYPVTQLHISAFHHLARPNHIQTTAQHLRDQIAPYFETWDVFRTWHVYTTERARKPNPYMLKAAGATIYYGDSPEDGEAARAANIPFVLVPRFI